MTERDAAYPWFPATIDAEYLTRVVEAVRGGSLGRLSGDSRPEPLKDVTKKPNGACQMAERMTDEEREKAIRAAVWWLDMFAGSKVWTEQIARLAVEQAADLDALRAKLAEVERDAAKDYADMRRFQESFIAADHRAIAAEERARVLSKTGEALCAAMVAVASAPKAHAQGGSRCDWCDALNNATTKVGKWRAALAEGGKP